MHALYFVRYIYFFFVVFFFVKKKKKKNRKKSRSVVSRSVVPPFRVPSFRGLLTTRTVSCFISVIEPCKENITLENNNVLETLLKTV